MTLGVDLPLLALTQGDPAGVGPEILLRSLEELDRHRSFRPLLIAERAALEPVRGQVAEALWNRLVEVEPGDLDSWSPAMGEIALLDPVGERRQVIPGESGAADAGGALAALDVGIGLCRSNVAAALVTAPVSKASIAHHHRSDFRGHTDYLAQACGLERYGRDYLMAFLAPDLQVVLQTVHEPLAEAVANLSSEAIEEALDCLDRHAGGRIAVAGLNPHAGEGGLLGSEDLELVRPAVEHARERGLDVSGPESPDSLFARCRQGEFDWVLALYHDQGLIAVKTVGFGLATNWTLGLPFLRTSVDHGTAFDRAGRGEADMRPMQRVLETTLELLSGSLPRRREGSSVDSPPVSWRHGPKARREWS